MTWPRKARTKHSGTGTRRPTSSTSLRGSKPFSACQPPRAELTPTEWEAMVHPDDLERHRSAILAHLRGEAPFFSTECRVRRRDGSYAWIQNRGLGLRDGSGRVYRMAGSFGDITPLKEREDQLAEAMSGKESALRELQTVLDNIEYGLLFMDADLRPRVANRALYRMWRLPESIITERPSWREMVEYARDAGRVPSAADWRCLGGMAGRARSADPRGRSQSPSNCGFRMAPSSSTDALRSPTVGACSPISTSLS